MADARKAKHADIEGILALAREAHSRSKYSQLAFNEGSCRRDIQRQIGVGLPPSVGASAIFVAGEKEIEAALAAFCSPLYGCLGALLITDTFWFAHAKANPRSGLAVLAAFHAWAEQCSGPYVIRQGVTDFIADDPERAGRLLASKGFRRAGLIYEKEYLA